MKLEIDFKKLQGKNISVGVYISCWYIFQRQQGGSKKHRENLDLYLYPESIPYFDQAIESGFLELINARDLVDPDNLRPTKKFLKYFQKTIEPDFDKFYQEWIHLWPKGVQSGGYYIRRSNQNTINKMKRFIKSHDFSYETIMKATENYISRMAENDYCGIRISDYFIFKDQGSDLAIECENYIENINSKLNTNDDVIFRSGRLL